MCGTRAAGLPGRIGREVPFVVRNGTGEVDGQGMEHSTVPCEVVDQHRLKSSRALPVAVGLRSKAMRRGILGPLINEVITLTKDCAQDLQIGGDSSDLLVVGLLLEE